MISLNLNSLPAVGRNYCANFILLCLPRVNSFRIKRADAGSVFFRGNSFVFFFKSGKMCDSRKCLNAVRLWLCFCCNWEGSDKFEPMCEGGEHQHTVGVSIWGLCHDSAAHSREFCGCESPRSMLLACVGRALKSLSLSPYDVWVEKKNSNGGEWKNIEIEHSEHGRVSLMSLEARRLSVWPKASNIYSCERRIQLEASLIPQNKVFAMKTQKRFYAANFSNPDVVF